MRAAICVIMFCSVTAFAAPVPRAQPLDPFGKGIFGVRAKDEESLEIQSVEPDSPAEAGGLQVNDCFLSVGTLKPKSFVELREYVLNLRPGTQTRVTVRREGKSVSMVVTVGQRAPDDLPRNYFRPDR